MQAAKSKIKMILKNGILYSKNTGSFVQLTKQKRLAMSLLKCGRDKVWLDPTQKEIIAKANTSTRIFINWLQEKIFEI